jgi:hypothetical protein
LPQVSALAGACLDVARRVRHASVAASIVGVIEVKLLTMKHWLTTTRARLTDRSGEQRSTQTLVLVAVATGGGATGYGHGAPPCLMWSQAAGACCCWLLSR